MQQPVAVLDLGSNSFHLLIVKKTAKGFITLCHQKSSVQLAKDLNEDNQLNPESIARAIHCLKQFQQVIQKHHASTYKIIGTHIFRQVQDTLAIDKTVNELFQQPIHKISGQQEALLMFQGVSQQENFKSNQTHIVFDVGGGSTEFVYSQQLDCHSYSLSIGCLTYLQNYFSKQNLLAEHFIEAEKNALQQLKHITLKTDSNNINVYGCAGTVQALQQLNHYYHQDNHLTLAYLDNIQQQLLTFSSIAEIDIPGLAKSHQGIVCSGLAIVKALFKKFQLQKMQTSKATVCHGLLTELI